jgi:hypothetical protein
MSRKLGGPWPNVVERRQPQRSPRQFRDCRPYSRFDRMGGAASCLEMSTLRHSQAHDRVQAHVCLGRACFLWPLKAGSICHFTRRPLSGFSMPVRARIVQCIPAP